MKNGRADDDDDSPRNDPKITRIEDARRRRNLGLAGGAQSGANGTRRTPVVRGDWKEWLVGALLIAMAIGFVVSLAAPYLGPMFRN